MSSFTVFIYDYDVPEYDIWHMMVDRREQGRGYGRAALAAVLDHIRTKPFGDSDKVTLTCNEDNATALGIYRKAGFAPTGNVDDDEVELSLDLG